MADDDDVRGAPAPEELLAPTGPRRASFTPAPNNAESLEAAAHLFNDDAIAAALAAELARVASGPIPVQRPVAAEPHSPQDQPAPPAPVAQEPASSEPEFADPVTPEPVAPEPVAPEPVAPEPVAPEPFAPEPVAPQPVAPEPVVPEPFVPEHVFPGPVATSSPTEDEEEDYVASPPPAGEPTEPTAPAVAETVAAPAPPPAPQGPPDWATPLFGQPTVTEQATPSESPRVFDPFAPSAPSFAPSTGPFPPPGNSAPEVPAGLTSPPADPDALRALYAAAPAPTVPAADAPPPPGYEIPEESTDSRSGRRALSDEASAPNLTPLEELQAQLDQRDRDAREYAAWESSMLEVGTPESLAAVDEARAERTGMPRVSSSAPEPLAPPVEEPAAFLPPPSEEPAAFRPPPVEEPAAFLPPPSEEPVAFAQAPLGAEVQPSPVSDNPFDIFSVDHEPESPIAPREQAAAFPGFVPPTGATTMDFSAPTDPHELTFESAPDQNTPVFLEPTAVASVSSPPGPPSWNIDVTPSVPSAGTPTETPYSHLQQELPPALVEPPANDGVADLWRTASQSATSAPAPSASEPTALEPRAPEPTPLEPRAPESTASEPARYADFSTPVPSAEAPPLATPAAAPSAPAPSMPQPPADLSQAPPPTGAPAPGFDDLLGGQEQPEQQPPSAAWVTGDPNPQPEPTIDAATGDRRPFGEGVDRDKAVDPSDTTFGVAHESIGLATADAEFLPANVPLESRQIVDSAPEQSIAPAPVTPVSVAQESVAPAPVTALPVAPRIAPAESVGLEPTPVEQRVGRAARLFWLWFAADSSIAAVIFGTIVFALGVSLRQAIVATLAGVALSFIPLGLGTLAGKRSGQPTMVISRATFGVVGNILPSLIALFSRVFWAAGLLWVLGAGTADILTGAQLTDGFTTGQLTFITMVIGFILAVVLAYFGYALVSVVQLVVSVISGIAIVGFIALTVQYVNVPIALSTPDGPWILVATGAVLVFSFVGLAWANSSSDVARYQRPGSSGAVSMLWATFGVALPSFVLIGYGALLAASNATLAANIAADPLDSLGRLLPVWYPGPLLAATGLSLLSGVVLALYSSGFALQATGLRLRRSLSTLLSGLLVLVIAIVMASTLTGLSQLFRDLATTVAVPVAAWAGIFGSEIMLRKRRFESHSLLNRGGIYADTRWGNLVALVAISAVGYGLLTATMPGLTWEGYLFGLFGVPLEGQFAAADIGVLVALLLGLAFPLAAGRGAIRAQELATRVPE